MEENKNKTVVDKIWDFFASIKLAVVLFALIALTSIIGTILEQNAEPEKNLQILGKLFGESMAPTLYSISDKLGFLSMYNSWWFVALLMLFAVNTVICSIDRLPRILNLVKEPIKPLTEEQFKNLGKKEIVLKGKPDKVKETAGELIKKAGFKFLEQKDGNAYQLYSEKGNYSRLGVYITHLSVLLILIGAIIGIFFGFKGFLNLPEGSTYAFAFSAKNRALSSADEAEAESIAQLLHGTKGDLKETALQLGIDEKTLDKKLKRYGIFPLGFNLRCDNFIVDFYGQSGMPKEFSSDLVVIKDGKEVMKKTIEVNDPLKYNGIIFYQSSYGIIPGSLPQGKLRLKLTSKSGITEMKELNINETFVVPGTDIQGQFLDFSSALAFDQSGRPYTYARQMNNPAAFVEFSEKGKTKYAGWLLQKYPETWRLPEGHIVEFMDYWGVEYTGLQVRKDPGVPVVYLGFFAMSLGLYVAFFMSHKKIWVKIAEEKNNTRVTVAFTANKNRPALESKIDKMIALLSKSEEGGK